MDKSLNLPDVSKLSKETTDVIAKVYSKIGSIRECKTLSDFGIYRYVLVKEFDQAIKNLIKGDNK